MRESRTGKRFPLHLPITIESKKNAKHTGTTANVSAAGVYLETDTEMAAGSTVRFDIRLPKDVLGTKADVTIKCVGRVIRNDTGKGKSGLACVIDEYKFKRGR